MLLSNIYVNFSVFSHCLKGGNLLQNFSHNFVHGFVMYEHNHSRGLIDNTNSLAILLFYIFWYLYVIFGFYLRTAKSARSKCWVVHYLVGLLSWLIIKQIGVWLSIFFLLFILPFILVLSSFIWLVCIFDYCAFLLW